MKISGKYISNWTRRIRNIRLRRSQPFQCQYFGAFAEHLPLPYGQAGVQGPHARDPHSYYYSAKHAKLVAEDRLIELCRQHGFKFPEREM